MSQEIRDIRVSAIKKSLLLYSNYIEKATLNSKFTCCILTHISLASYFGDIGKHHKPIWVTGISIK